MSSIFLVLNPSVAYKNIHFKGKSKEQDKIIDNKHVITNKINVFVYIKNGYK